MKISVIGTGYVGLVTGTCLAETGNYVNCIDIDECKVNKLNNGEITIYEPGLEKIFKRNVSNGNLKFKLDLSEIDDSEIIFLALPTPPDKDGFADLKYVLEVASELGKLIKSYKIIVNKSTVPLNTTELVKKEIKKNFNGEFDVVSNPEFLREGVAVNDFMKPDRIVIGTKSKKAIEKMKILYKPYVKQNNPLVIMDEKSAELTKYAANSFLATKISFMNEISNVCEIFGADIDLVRKGIGSDHRIGKSFLYAGIGYGGSCFPKDVKALIQSSNQEKYEMKILKSVEEVNHTQKSKIFQKVKQYFNNDIHSKKFAVWGLSFKPDTDDMREAPSIIIINELLSNNCEINCYDPEATKNASLILKDSVSFFNNKYDCLKDVDALLICTEWSEFKAPDFDRIKSLMKNQLIFDGRNIFELDIMEKENFNYISIGRKKIWKKS